MTLFVRRYLLNFSFTDLRRHYLSVLVLLLQVISRANHEIVFLHSNDVVYVWLSIGILSVCLLQVTLSVGVIFLVLVADKMLSRGVATSVITLVGHIFVFGHVFVLWEQTWDARISFLDRGGWLNLDYTLCIQVFTRANVAKCDHFYIIILSMVVY